MNLRRAAELSGRDWQFAATAVVELLRARARHAMRPTGVLLRELQAGEARPPAGSSITPGEVARIGWAIEAVAPRLPWRADCLLKAMAAARWLRRRGYPCEFHLGVRRAEDGALLAHAWIMSGEECVAGGDVSGHVLMMGSTSPATAGGRAD